MTAGRAWVGDLVRDGDGRRAIVTDVRAGGTGWMLRPPTGLVSRASSSVVRRRFQ
ncbi:hypothetical protein J3A78_002725 [Streptomyces sp. PvR006]|nr:hypothetical protein [Streptomyces sp. PvR006]